jgi:hypothetical protein
MSNLSLCNIPQIKTAYVSLLNDNITYLVEYIYSNRNVEPYNNIEIRVALSLQMILSSNKLINPLLSSLIAKDISDLMNDSDYLSRFDNKEKKLKSMETELSYLIKNTEITDNISLNISEEDIIKRNELKSSISTMMPVPAVSKNVPMKFEPNDQATCNLQ